jgi:hypothetical protein
VAVVAARELDNLVATGDTAGKAEGAHGGLGATGDKANTLHGGNGIDDQPGQVGFGLGGGAKAAATGQGIDHRRLDQGMTMPQDHRPPGTDVVEVLLAIDVKKPGALRPLDEQGFASHGAESTGRTVDTTRDEGLRPAEGLGAFGSVHLRNRIHQQRTSDRSTDYFPWGAGNFSRRAFTRSSKPFSFS